VASRNLQRSGQFPVADQYSHGGGSQDTGRNHGPSQGRERAFQQARKPLTTPSAIATYEYRSCGQFLRARRRKAHSNVGRQGFAHNAPQPGNTDYKLVAIHGRALLRGVPPAWQDA